jgi:probable HAF family extracellular repeat protein
MNDLGVAFTGGTRSEGNAIDGSNNIAGDGDGTFGGSTHTHGFYRVANPVSVTDIGTLSGDVDSQAYALNNGVLAGWSGKQDDTEKKQAVTYKVSTQSLVGLGHLSTGDISWGWALNDLGDVAGYSNLTAGGTSHHACVWWAATNGVTDLGTLSGANSEAFGINHSQQVVGYSLVTTGDRQHAIFYDGTLHDLNLISSGDSLTLLDARAITDDGHIVGKGVTAGGVGHAYLLTPVGTGPSVPSFWKNEGGGAPGTWLDLAVDLTAEMASPVMAEFPPACPSPAAVDCFWIAEDEVAGAAWWEWDSPTLL